MRGQKGCETYRLIGVADTQELLIGNVELGFEGTLETIARKGVGHVVGQAKEINVGGIDRVQQIGRIGTRDNWFEAQIGG
jgi:hypothetical protein